MLTDPALNVPMFAGSRLQSGTMERDSEGCILVAFRHKETCLMDSQLAFNALFSLLSGAQKHGEEMPITVFCDSEMLRAELNQAP